MLDELETAVSNLKRAFGEAVAAPDLEGLERLEAAMPQLPDSVRVLYRNIGGVQTGGGCHLMSPTEVLETLKIFRDMEKSSDYGQQIGQFGNGCLGLLLIADGSSNWLGLKLKEPYAPRGFVFDHDEPSGEPRFKSLASMIERFIEHAANEPRYDFHDIAVDYPVLDPRHASAEDRALSFDLLRQYFGDPVRKVSKAFGAMQLSHPEDMEEFLPLIDDDDMWVAEAMFALVGKRRFVRAIDRMVDATVRGGGNRISAAVVTLRSWPDDRARNGLRLLRDRLGDAFPPYFLNDVP